MSKGQLVVEFKKADITPAYPVRLAGYFSERISEGVLDPLHMRLGAVGDGKNHLLFIQVDNCAIPVEDAEEIRRAVSGKSIYRKHEIMLFTTHIHTGPDLVGFFGLSRDERYLKDLKKRIVEEAVRLKPGGQSSVSTARATYKGLSFNRRWFMKDGTVVTNPPKMSPERIEAEGPVDREANSIMFHDERGDLQAVFVNISNHTDTIGGSMISADWPGFLERYLNESLGTDIPVFLFLAPQGNINHLEFDDDRPQSNYQEAERLGRAYGEILVESFRRLKPLALEGPPGGSPILEAKEIILPIPSREIAEAELEEARKILSWQESPGQEKGRALTAEDLAKGNPAVERLFAREFVQFAEHKPEIYPVPLQAFRLGSLAFAAIPGEPFVEVGLELKTFRRFELVFPVALANGYYGYIPLRENFGRGGYETRTGPTSCLSRDAADRILAAFRSLLL